MPYKKASYLKCPICHNLSKPQLKYSLENFNLYTCASCSNGFIHPTPTDTGKYYPDNYWKLPGLLGYIKDHVYDFFQSRRPRFIEAYLKKGQVLDVGAGEASFASRMAGYDMTSIDFPGSKIKNPEVLKIDFLKWRTVRKFDAIVFWQSLEHVPDAGSYLKKAYQLLKKGGLIFIECPSFNSFESKLFGKNWYHLDPPRHLSHFSIEGLSKILKKQKLSVISKINVISPEHAYPGFLASILNSLGFNFMDSYLKKKNTFPLFVIALALSPVAFALESALLLLGYSPVILVIARKTK